MYGSKASQLVFAALVVAAALHTATALQAASTRPPPLASAKAGGVGSLVDFFEDNIRKPASRARADIGKAIGDVEGTARNELGESFGAVFVGAFIGLVAYRRYGPVLGIAFALGIYAMYPHKDISTTVTCGLGAAVYTYGRTASFITMLLALVTLSGWMGITG